MIFLLLFSFTDNLNHINQNEKIYLEKESRGARSATTTTIEAVLNESSLSVTISDYTEMIWVEIFGEAGELQQSDYIDETNQISLDLYVATGQIFHTYYFGRWGYFGNFDW